MKKGFTLMELLIVIAIVGILSLIFLGALRGIGTEEANGILPLSELCNDRKVECRDDCTYSDENLTQCLLKCDIRLETCYK